MPQCAGGGVVRWSPLWQKNGVSPILFACKENEKFIKEFEDLWDNSAAAESSINCCFIVTLTCYPFSFHRMARRRLMNLMYKYTEPFRWKKVMQSVEEKKPKNRAQRDDEQTTRKGEKERNIKTAIDGEENENLIDFLVSRGLNVIVVKFRVMKKKRSGGIEKHLERGDDDVSVRGENWKMSMRN